MKTLERRQEILNKLFERSLTGDSLVNPTNTIYDFNAREVIKADPFVYQLWKCRTRIVKGEPEVAVPDKAFEFFVEYTKGISSPSKVIVDIDFEYGPLWDDSPLKQLGIMYSGGSESIMMDATFSLGYLIRVHNFFPNTAMPREFQLALIGMALGFNVTMIGCGYMSDMITPRDFEYKPTFVDLWNEFFQPTTLQYPLGWRPTKDEVIEFLLKSKYEFVSCETLKDGKECGKCWHCAEKYFSMLALTTRKDYADLKPMPDMDPKFLKRLQEANTFNLSQEVDKFAMTTNYFKLLENKYGVTSWREGDPTKPFGK